MAAKGKKKKKNVNHAAKRNVRRKKPFWTAFGLIALCVAVAVCAYLIRSRKVVDPPPSVPAEIADSLVIGQGDDAAAQEIAEGNQKLENAVKKFIGLISKKEALDASQLEDEESDSDESSPAGGGGGGGGGYMPSRKENPDSEKETAPPKEAVVTITTLPPLETISFPYAIPGTSLTIEQVSPYSGYYLEDGSDDAISNVATIVLRNSGGDLSFAGIGISQGDRNLAFSGSNIPAGATMIIQEQSRAAYMDGSFYTATATTTPGSVSVSSDALSVTDNGDNTFTVTNVSGQSIGSAVISYKSYLPGEDVYVGGITYTVNLTGLEADTPVVVDSGHYVSGYSVILSAQVN